MDISGEVYGLYCVCGDCELARPGKIRYVGVTVEGRGKRLKAHLNESRTNSQKAKDRWIRKHGPDNIRTRLLETVTTVIEDLRIAEIGWISKLGTYDNGLNMTRGGDGIWGYTFAPEVKRWFQERTAQQMAVKHPRAKLNRHDVTLILDRLWRGESPSTIADDYPVSKFSIQKISDGINWPDVTRPVGPRNKPVNERMSKAWATRRLVE